MDKKLESVEFGRSFRVDNVSYDFGSDDDGASNFCSDLKSRGLRVDNIGTSMKTLKGKK